METLQFMVKFFFAKNVHFFEKKCYLRCFINDFLIIKLYKYSYHVSLNKKHEYM